jgi:ribosomal protein L11 methyltransferase
MEYVEVTVKGLDEQQSEILTAGLCELGFESFSPEPDGFLAYVPLHEFDLMKVSGFLELNSLEKGFTYSVSKIAEQNWNAIWESSYSPVRVGNCYIRAPFHPPDPEASTELVIEPKMSFGTAHHETTRLMLAAVMETDMNGAIVLDMGTGTGILAILASKLGASSVTAIDTDEWSCLNTEENVRRNAVAGISVIQGDCKVIPSVNYTHILANINRNVLLADLPVYHSRLADGGILLMSGFYEEDLPLISKAAEDLGLVLRGHNTMNHWMMAGFSK